MHLAVVSPFALLAYILQCSNECVAMAASISSPDMFDRNEDSYSFLADTDSGDAQAEAQTDEAANWITHELWDSKPDNWHRRPLPLRALLNKSARVPLPSTKAPQRPSRSTARRSKAFVGSQLAHGGRVKLRKQKREQRLKLRKQKREHIRHAVQMHRHRKPHAMTALVNKIRVQQASKGYPPNIEAVDMLSDMLLKVWEGMEMEKKRCDTNEEATKDQLSGAQESISVDRDRLIKLEAGVEANLAELQTLQEQHDDVSERLQNHLKRCKSSDLMFHEQLTSLTSDAASTDQTVSACSRGAAALLMCTFSKPQGHILSFVQTASFKVVGQFKSLPAQRAVNQTLARLGMHDHRESPLDGGYSFVQLQSAQKYQPRTPKWGSWKVVSSGQLIAGMSSGRWFKCCQMWRTTCLR